MQTVLVFAATGIAALYLFAIAIGYLSFGNSEKAMATGVEKPDKAPTPVTLVSYSGKVLNEKQVVLSWATATEKENNFYTVYKSSDGIDYAELDKVNSKGSSNNIQYYSLLDAEPYSENTYYKLCQTNFCGRSIDVEIIRVRTPKTLQSKLQTAYPNPFFDEVTVSIPEGTEVAATATLYNLKGEKVFEKKMEVDEGQTELNIKSLDALRNGTYFVKISRGSETTESIKIVKK